MKMFFRFFLYLLKLGATAVTIFLLVIGSMILYYSKQLPDYSSLAKYQPSLTTRIYSIDGKLIQQYAKENRIFVPISSIPESLKNAFVAAEDKNFYHHKGIDLLGIGRASISNIYNYFNNKRLEGASTITQQVVKNFLLTNEKSIVRKIKEAILSYVVSNSLSKDQILELYLNQTFLGKGAYGVAAAAQRYFNKSVDELTIPESAFLAALPKAPSFYDPKRNYERSKHRRDYVINRMLDEAYISEEEAKDSIATPIILRKRSKTEHVNAGYFAEQVRNIVIDMYGEHQFYEGGLTIITTLDSHMQKEAEKAFSYGIEEFDRKKGYRGPIARIKTENWEENLNKIYDQEGQKDNKLSVIIDVNKTDAKIGLKNGNIGSINIKEALWAKAKLNDLRSIFEKGDVILVHKLKEEKYTLKQIPLVNGGMLATDASTGAIKAYIGGYDYQANKFDRVTQAKRQPGSCIKSFVYLAALEEGIAPNSIFNDSPIEIEQGKGLPTWKPKNHDEKFWGDITLRTALEKSRNLVTIKVAKEVGIEKISEILKRFGVTKNAPPYYSIALGAVDTTLLNMINGYASLASGGYKVIPHFIELIHDKDGNIIYKRDDSICRNCQLEEDEYSLPEMLEQEKEYLISPQDAYQINSLLKGSVQRGTSRKLAKHNIPLAGKTGTTNKSFDAWQIAYTPELVMGTYIGYDQPRSLGVNAYGVNVALPVIDVYIKNIKSRLSKNDFEIPTGIEFYKIDKETGEISFNKENSILEAFKTTQSKIPEKYQSDFDEIDTNEIFGDEEMSIEQINNFLEDMGEIY